jgi:hypothetical protein
MRHPVEGNDTLVVTCLACEWYAEADTLREAGKLMDDHMGQGD